MQRNEGSLSVGEIVQLHTRILTIKSGQLNGEILPSESSLTVRYEEWPE